MAKGYAQKPGIDYEETYLPVIHGYSLLRAFLSDAVERDMIIHQMDVQTAFLNRTLSEDMPQPDGKPGKEQFVCKLSHSRYDLKQSPKCRNEVVDTYLKSLGLAQSNADVCVYIR